MKITAAYRDFVKLEKRLRRIAHEVQVLKKNLEIKEREHQAVVEEFASALKLCQERVHRKVTQEISPRIKSLKKED